MGFITVKYGAGEERIANPNVLSSVLLHYLKSTCGYSDLSENVDLASETGEVIDLINKSKEYAKRFVDPRGTYILVKVTGGTFVGVLWKLCGIDGMGRIDGG
ncbi:hypothetical protein HKX48_002544 [Thoreauomyces humboldtii]|nr:hypothetical protein HKX48_002544 [Thoreauomyces humboldtii]